MTSSCDLLAAGKLLRSRLRLLVLSDDEGRLNREQAKVTLAVWSQPTSQARKHSVANTIDKRWQIQLTMTRNTSRLPEAKALLLGSLHALVKAAAESQSIVNCTN